MQYALTKAPNVHATTTLHIRNPNEIMYINAVSARLKSAVTLSPYFEYKVTEAYRVHARVITVIRYLYNSHAVLIKYWFMTKCWSLKREGPKRKARLSTRGTPKRAKKSKKKVRLQ